MPNPLSCQCCDAGNGPPEVVKEFRAPPSDAVLTVVAPPAAVDPMSDPRLNPGGPAVDPPAWNPPPQEAKVQPAEEPVAAPASVEAKQESAAVTEPVKQEAAAASPAKVDDKADNTDAADDKDKKKGDPRGPGMKVPEKVSFLQTPLGFFLGILFLSAGACAVSFVLIPVSNPLHEDNWWHCSLTCTCVWVPVSILYITKMLEDIVYVPVGKHIGAFQFFLMWFIQALVMSSVLIALAVFWVNPAPMNGAIAATAGIVCNALIIYLCFVPALGRSLGRRKGTILPWPNNANFDLQLKAIAVLVFFVLSVLQLMFMLFLSAFLLWIGRWYVSLAVLPSIRLIFLASHGTFARFMDDEGSILGQNMAMVTVGIAMAIAVGSAGTWEFTLCFFIIDVGQGVHAALCLANVKCCGIEISALLLSKYDAVKNLLSGQPLKNAHSTISRQETDSRSAIQTTFIIAAEAGEVVVPMNYALCWFIVRMGPNNESFTGTGTSEFGLEAPDDLSVFMINIVALFSCECISMMVIKYVLKYMCHIDIYQAMKKSCAMFGPILITQSVWVIVTSFCMTMIHCGLDYSFSWSYVADSSYTHRPSGRAQLLPGE